MSPGRSRHVVLACALLIASGAPARAHADGALPNSLGVLLPSDRPHSILIATNFGLLSSEDDGASWSLVCEEAVGVGAALYQIGPPPEDRLFTVTSDGIARSTDFGCGWEQSPEPYWPTDVFADPSDAGRVYAIAHVMQSDAGSPPQAVFASDDGGHTFGTALFTGPAAAYLTGVEAAASDDGVVYISLTQLDANDNHPYLMRSRDRGASWTMLPIESSVGKQLPRILAVDADDARRVYLRLSNGKDQLGIYDDDTGKVDVVLSLPGFMTAFLRRADGALLVAGDDGSIFASQPGGKSFVQLASSPHLRGLGERAGTLYAATDVSQDDFAVAASTDDGATWKPLLRFTDIAGLRQCGTIPATCAAAWDAIQPGIAMPLAPRPVPDTGVSPTGTDESGGCAVRRGGVSASNPAGLAAIAVACILLRMRRRARHLRNSTQATD